MPLRQRDILKALREKHNGAVTAVGSSNILCKLMGRSLSNREISIISGHLDDLHVGGRIVVDKDQAQRVQSITLPELATPEAVIEENEATMPAPKGQHHTKSPMTSDCKPIGDTLSDDQVGPVTVRHVSQTQADAREAADEVATAGGLVVEELAKADDKPMNYESLALFIRAVLGTLYTPAALPAITQQVANWLVDNKHLHRNKPVPNKPAVYTFQRPVSVPQEENDPNRIILQLIGDVRAAKEREVGLNRRIAELEAAAAQQISSEKLRQILGDLKTLRETEKRLNRELQEAKVTQERKDVAHKQELRALRDQLSTANQANADLQQQLKTRTTVELDPVVQQELRELGY